MFQVLIIFALYFLVGAVFGPYVAIGVLMALVYTWAWARVRG